MHPVNTVPEVFKGKFAISTALRKLRNFWTKDIDFEYVILLTGGAIAY